MNPAIIAAASLAFLNSYAYGLQITAYTSLGFGGLGLLLCFYCEDTGPKMNNRTENFLENDVYVDMNECFVLYDRLGSLTFRLP